MTIFEVFVFDDCCQYVQYVTVSPSMCSICDCNFIFYLQFNSIQ